MKKIFLAIVSLLIIISVTGCKKSESGAIKIGAIFSVTGANSPLGEPEKNTAQMLVDKYNASNPAQKVELIVYDDEGDATKAQNFATKLIEEDKCIAVVGPTITGTSLKVLEVATENKTPLISCAAAASIVEPVKDRKWIFKTAQSDKHAVGRLYKYITSKGLKKIAIITVSNGYGQSGKSFLESLSKDFGIQLVANETYGAQDTDMKAQLTKIKGANPDAIICWGTNPGPAYVDRNAKELGIKAPIFQSHGVANSQYISLAGDSCEGTYLVAGKLLIFDNLPDSNPQKSVLAGYSKDYNDMFKTSPNTFGGHAWDAVSLVLKAIDSVKPSDSSEKNKLALRDFIENSKGFVGISGVFNFSDSDHNGLTEDAFSIITIKNGKWTLLE